MPVIIYNILHTNTNLLFFIIYILCFIQFLSAARVVDFVFIIWHFFLEGGVKCIPLSPDSIEERKYKFSLNYFIFCASSLRCALMSSRSRPWIPSLENVTVQTIATTKPRGCRGGGGRGGDEEGSGNNSPTILFPERQPFIMGLFLHFFFVCV